MQHLELKIGDILVAKHECRMKDGSGNALIIGKEYPIKDIVRGDIIIESELFQNHYFELNPGIDGESYNNFFDLKK